MRIVCRCRPLVLKEYYPVSEPGIVERSAKGIDVMAQIEGYNLKLLKKESL